MQCECCRRSATKVMQLYETVWDSQQELYTFNLCMICFDYILGIIKRATGRK
jgi:hypothetical protein